MKTEIKVKRANESFAMCLFSPLVQKTQVVTFTDTCIFINANSSVLVQCALLRKVSLSFVV